MAGARPAERPGRRSASRERRNMVALVTKSRGPAPSDTVALRDRASELWFESADVARIVVSRRLEVLSANRAAHALLADGETLTLRGNVLAARTRDDQRQLDDLTIDPPAGEYLLVFTGESAASMLIGRARPLGEGACIGLAVWPAG